MGWWQVSADTLAASRFVVSPVAETFASLMDLARAGPRHAGERAWLDAHLPAYRDRLAADPVAARLVEACFATTWIPDFLTPTPRPAGDRGPSFADEVARVRATPPERARADVGVALKGTPLPTVLAEADLPGAAADLLDWVWSEAVAPYWDARRRVLEADVVARIGQLGKGGWAAALDAMRPGMRWLGEGRLQINTHDYPPREVLGGQLLFVPVTPKRAWVSWDSPRYAIVYPASGTLAEAVFPRTAAAERPDALARLLGPGRAAVLRLLESPLSTTQLVALTGLGLGSVGGHLKVLADARLVRRRRAGRSVLYFRTSVGESLVAAQSGE